MLDFADADSICAEYVAGLFTVEKDATLDRLITNRKPENSRERSIGASRWLFPHPSQLGDTCLGPGECLRASGDDLPDFYHTVQTSEARTRSNAFGPRVPWASVAGLPAARRLLARQAGLRPPEFVRALQRTLPMGDVNATDFAQAAHVGALRAGGCCRKEEMVSYREPFPYRAPGAPGAQEWIMIDDRAITGVGPRALARAAEWTDVELVDCGMAAYDDANLFPKPSKQYRYKHDFALLGAEVWGCEGWLSTKRGSLLIALALSLGICRARAVPLDSLEVAASLWSNALLYQRLGFCIPDRIYEAIGAARKEGRSMLQVGDAARDELLALAVLSPFWGTDMRMPVSTRLLATDASGGARSGLGACATELEPAAATELWRHRARRGGYTGCLPRDKAAMRELLERLHDPDIDLFDAALEDDPEAARLTTDLRARVGQLCDACSWKESFRANADPYAHINAKELFAVRSALRRELAKGLQDTRQLVCVDSLVVLFVLVKGRSASRKLLTIVRSFACELLFAGVVLGLLPVPTKQNPSDAPSRHHRVRRGPAATTCSWARAFAARGAGPRRWPHEPARARREHFLLPEKADHGPTVAVPIVHEDGAVSPRDSGLSTASSAGTAGDGPRERDYSADLGARLISSEERSKRATVLADWHGWAAAAGADPDAMLAGVAPLEVVESLRQFGQFLYMSDRSRGDFAALVLAIADRRRDWRALLTGAWDIDRAWQALEPTVHHVPMSHVLFRAGVAVAALRQDTPMVLQQMAGFQGGVRPGEGRKLLRRDVVLPADLGSSDPDTYLIVRNPKCRGQQFSSQHVTVVDDTFGKVFSWALRNFDDNDPLWPDSDSQYLTRWDALFGRTLGVSTHAPRGVTPASLRAGSAVALYKATGGSLDAVQWHLRHQCRRTLSHYIQELPEALARGRLTGLTLRLVTRFAAVADAALVELMRTASPLPGFRRPRPQRPRAMLPPRARLQPPRRSAGAMTRELRALQDTQGWNTCQYDPSLGSSWHRQLPEGPGGAL